MLNNSPLVSIVIPTKNSSLFLKNCLESIKAQTYSDIEVIIVDGNSTDDTLSLAKKYNCKVLQYDPGLPKGTFDAPQRRNYGASQALGLYVYYVDADMELGPHVITEAVHECQHGAAAVIVPEDSFGEGAWARAKNLERQCYWGDDTIEAPRFIVKEIWDELGGLDESLGGGGDDWDLHEKLKSHGYKVSRTSDLVRHNEGHLQIKKLMKKRFMYGRDSAKYIAKRPKAGITSYFPIRRAYVRNWRIFLRRPHDTINFIVMRTLEYSAGLAGILFSLIQRKRS